MDAFDLNLVTNHEVLAVNQDALAPRASASHPRRKQRGLGQALADGSVAVGPSTTETDQVLTLTDDWACRGASATCGANRTSTHWRTPSPPE